MKNFNYHFNEFGLCYVSSIRAFIDKCADGNLYILTVYGSIDNSTVKDLNFYFSSLLSVHCFLKRYRRPHSYNFWCNVLKRFPDYNYNNVSL